MRKARTVKQFGRVRRSRTKNGEYITKFEVAKLELHKGDILVLRTEAHLSLQTYDRLRKSLSELFKDVKVVVLSEGLSLAVLQDKRAA